MKFNLKFQSREVRQGLKKLPAAYEKNIIDAQDKTAKEALKFMRMLAPEDTGELKSEMYIQREDGGRKISAEAAAPNKQDQIKARSIHGGRDRGSKGETDAIAFVGRARGMIKTKHKGRVTRALLKARKEVGLKK